MEGCHVETLDPYLGSFSLVVCFLLSAAVVSFACSVTNRTIIESHLNDCSPSGSSQIYKTETNQITFSDGDFDNVQTYGLGHCGSPSVSGSFTKCYPAFNTPTTGACSPSACNCVRWSQFIQGKMDSCGLFSCSCVNSGSHEQFYLEETCFNELCQGEPLLCDPPWKYNPCACCCDDSQMSGACNGSPILIDISGDGFALTSAQMGVNFDGGVTAPQRSEPGPQHLQMTRGLRSIATATAEWMTEQNCLAIEFLFVVVNLAEPRNCRSKLTYGRQKRRSNYKPPDLTLPN